MTAPHFPARTCRSSRSSARRSVSSAAPAPTPPSLPFDEALQLFLADQALRGRRPLTCKRHAQDLRALGRYLDAEHLIWTTLSFVQMRAYLRTRSALSTSSQANQVCTLRVFFAWAVELGLIRHSPAAELSTPARSKSVPRALSRATVRKLVAYLAAQRRIASRRDEMMILTAIYAGLRRRELAELDWTAIDLDAKVVTVFKSKMNRGRGIRLHASLIAKLAGWREAQGQGGVGPVFGWEGKPITPDRVWKIVKLTAARCGIAFTPHTLRHTFATWAYREGRDINSVSKALGHAELRQTMIYVAADSEDSRVAVDSLPDIDEW